MKPYPTRPTLRVFFAITFRVSPTSVPSMCISDCNQRTQHIAPRIWRGHGSVGEHATVPTNMFKGPRRNSILITHPQARDLYDIHLPVRIIRGTMTARLVMRSRSVNGPVILCDMEIDRPRTQR